MNPLGNSPIFLLLTRNASTAARSMLSWRIALNSFLLVIISFFIGTHILRFFGISLPVVQIGGGLVVISTGWTMLKANDEDDDNKTDDVKSKMVSRDVLAQAFYPLTLPLTVGPGSISVAIALGANEPQHVGFNVPAAIAGLVVVGGNRNQYLSVLPIRGKIGTAARKIRDERDYAAVVILAGMHRRADSLERCDRIIEVDW